MKSQEKPTIYVFDKLIIGYCLFMVLLLLAVGRPMRQYFDEVLFYASMATLVALIIRFVPEHKNRFSKLIRLLYPGFIFIFFYRETGGTMFLLFDSFYDWQLIAFEKSLFGIHPTLYIDRHLLNVWLNELFSFCYSFYYLMLSISLAYMFLRKDYEILKNFLAASSLTFFLSYFLFFLYPVEGPRWHFMAEYVNQIEGPVFRQITEFFIEKGAVRGGCMPSSHFGLALVILIYCFKYYRNIAWMLMPIVIGLGIGTVWGRFHYISDVFVGGLIGLFSVLFVWKYCAILPDQQYNNSKAKEPAPENVS